MIGIYRAIFSESGGNVGIGFAVPIDIAKRIVPELIRSGRVARAYLGIGYRPLDSRVNRALQIDAKITGLLVTNVEPGSPAARAGIHGLSQVGEGYAVGDIILSVDGRPTGQVEDLSYVLNQKRPGETVQLEVLRNGHTERVSVTLGETARQRSL
jgi:S1-C subfamily serine protease